MLTKEDKFEDNEDEYILQRDWEGLLPNRYWVVDLLEINGEIGTSVANHVIFPDVEKNKRKASFRFTLQKRRSFIEERQFQIRLK